jgi:ribosomal protein S18 acetylase RimI-like enzyme
LISFIPGHEHLSPLSSEDFGNAFDDITIFGILKQTIECIIYLLSSRKFNYVCNTSDGKKNVKDNCMEIIKLDPQHKKKAAEVVAAAFYDYPMFTFYFPDPERRSRYLPWYLGNVLNCALHYGEVYTNPEITGVIFTLPPGHTKISQWEYIQNGFLLTPFMLGRQNYQNSSMCEDFVANTHEKLMNNRPHIYLWGLAIHPDQKRKGIGSALLQPVVAQADARKLPVYLETHDEKNVEYYQKHGFDLIHTDEIPKFELPIWCMLREPV